MVRLPAVLLVLCVVTGEQQAEACSGSAASILRQFPRADGASGQMDALVVHMIGEVYAEPSPLITDANGDTLDHAFRTESYNVGLYSNVYFFYPASPLPLGSLNFAVAYRTRNGAFEQLDAVGPAVPFEVVEAIDRTPTDVGASWDRVNFDERTGTSCGEYIQQVHIELQGEPTADEELWLLVEVSGQAREGVETFSGTERRTLVPTRTTTELPSLDLVVELLFEADCVSVTPLSRAGPAGETYETCQPDRCLDVNSASTSPFDPVDLDEAEACPRPNAPQLETGTGGCGCSATTPAAAGAPYGIGLLFFAVVVRRRSRRSDR